MANDGSCPSCGRRIATAAADEPRAPWHFKLMVAAVGLYLAWRLVDMVKWVL